MDGRLTVGHVEGASTSEATTPKEGTDPELLYREAGPQLWRSIYGFAGGRRDVADDAVAEAFARAIEHASTIRDPLAWIYRTASRIASNELRHERRQPPPAPDPVPGLDAGELHDVFRALGTLSPNQRAAGSCTTRRGSRRSRSDGCSASRPRPRGCTCSEPADGSATCCARRRTSMDDRWQDAATRLRQVRPPADLWGRIEEGPQPPPLPPPRRTRVTAAVAALGIFAIVGVVLWATITPIDDGANPLAGSDVVPVPPRGDVSAIFLADGRPVFVVHHQDGSVSVVDAFSSHRAWGIEELNVWCSSTREFVEVAHGARFDEYGAYASVGPAPGGVATFAFSPVELDDRGDPASIEVGAMREPSPVGSAPEVPQSRPTFCSGMDAGSIVAHSIPEGAIVETPAAAVEAAPDGWIAVRGTLLVASDGFAQLCAEVDGERCVDGAVVRGIDGIGLMLNVTRGPDVTAYEQTQLWLARVDGGVLDDIAGIPGTLEG